MAYQVPLLFLAGALWLLSKPPARQPSSSTQSAQLVERVKFRRQRGGNLILSSDVVACLLKHRQLKSSSLEAGGLLIGRQIEGTDHIVIDSNSIPIAADRRHRRSLQLHVGHNEFAKVKYVQSSQTQVVRGNWHTHPEGTPSPSLSDRKYWRKCMSAHSEKEGSLFFVIAGTDSVMCWEGDLKSKKLRKMEQL